jgi:PAS domain S-box-containing protein
VVVSLGIVAVIAKYRSAMAFRLAIEQRLNDGLDAANAAVWDMNLKTGEEYWSDSYYRILGFEPGKSPASVNARVARIHPDDRAHVLESWEAAINKRSMYVCQYRIVGLDGTVRWVEAKGKPTFDSDGKPIPCIGGLVDITDRKRALSALIEAEKSAATGKMAASLAHEINNPLESLTNLVYVMKNQPTGPVTTREYLQLAEDEVRRIARLVQKVLAVQREPFRLVRADIGSVVTAIVALYQSPAREREIRVDIRADNQAELVCNPEEVRLALTNLFVNAIEGAQNGGRILVHVYGCADWSDGRRRGVRVTFADNGKGIPAEQMAAVFQPFVTRNGEQRTEFGLWITKEIVEKSGGSVRLRSRIAHPSGTCISVFSPPPSRRFQIRPESPAAYWRNST